jgi:hypothetical protein
MTPKEKAIELVNKYYNKIEHTISDEYAEVTKEITKVCALIAVDEILKLDNHNTYNYLTENKEHLIVQLANNYWNEVKQEIEKL